MISVFIVDDHAPMRAVLSLRLALEPDIIVIGDAGHEAKAFARIRNDAPQVVLLDLISPIAAIELAPSHIGELARIARVVVLSLYDDTQTREALLQAGAAAVVSKHDSDDALFAAIRAAVITAPPIPC